MGFKLGKGPRILPESDARDCILWNPSQNVASDGRLRDAGARAAERGSFGRVPVAVGETLLPYRVSSLIAI